MMNLKVRNAICIKFRTLINSVAIRLSLILMLILSIAIAFWPFFSKIFTSHDQVNIETSLSLKQLDKYNLVMDGEKEPDVKIIKENDIYQIDVLTKTGYINVNKVLDYLNNINIYDLVQSGKLDETQMMQVTNQNIQVNYVFEYKLGENGYNFLMAFLLIFNFLIILLISRIGAQVAYEKGNKVTDVILTSITGSQLYFAEVVASIFIVLINLIIVSIPLFLAFIINQSDICSDLSFFTIGKILMFVLHLIITTLSLVICIIGFCSRVKQSEDSNAYIAMVIIPLYLSLVYLIFNMDMFRGILYPLNIIPITSMFPVVGAVLNETISGIEFTLIELGTVVFIIVEYLLIKKMFVKNISKK